MAAGTPDEKFQKLREENERRRKKKEEDEKRRKQEEELKAKEALERRRQERLEHDERMRKPYQHPPAPKKPILRKGAKQKPVQPDSPALDPVRQSQAAEKRREWRQGLQDFIKQQRLQAGTGAKTGAGAATGPSGGAGQDGAPVVPLTWDELRMAAEAGFDELLRQQELQAEQRGAEEPTSRAARNRFKSPFRGAPAPPQETVQIALVPTQQYNTHNAPSPAVPAGPTRGSPMPSPRSGSDRDGGAGVTGAGTPQGDRLKYSDSDTPGWGNPAAAGGEAPLGPCRPPPQLGNLGMGGAVTAHANGGVGEGRPHQSRCADAVAGDSGLDRPPAAVLYPPVGADGPRRGSWADGFASLAGDDHAACPGGADGGSSVGDGGVAPGAAGSVASSGGLRRGVTSTARHRVAPMDPSSLDLGASPLSSDAACDPWVDRVAPSYAGDSAAALGGSLRSPYGQRLTPPGPCDEPSQQLWPPAEATPPPAGPPAPPQREPHVSPLEELGLPGDPLEACLEAGGTLAALQQAEGLRLSSPRSAGQRPPPPPPPYLELPPQDLLAQQPFRPADQQRHQRRGWSMPAAAAPPPHPGPSAAAAAKDPHPYPPGYPSLPAWTRDGMEAMDAAAASAPGEACPVQDRDFGPSPRPAPGADGAPSCGFAAPSQGIAGRGPGQKVWLPAAIRHSLAVGDSGGPAMWQRESVALHLAVPPPPPPVMQSGPVARPLSPPPPAPAVGFAAPRAQSAAPLQAMQLADQPPEGRHEVPPCGTASGLSGWQQGQGVTHGSFGRVDLSADLVRFSSPPGPSPEQSDGLPLAELPPPPKPAQSGSGGGREDGQRWQQQKPQQQQALQQQPPPQQAPVSPPRRSTWGRLAGASLDGAAPVDPSLGPTSTPAPPPSADLRTGTVQAAASALDHALDLAQGAAERPGAALEALPQEEEEEEEARIPRPEPQEQCQEAAVDVGGGIRSSQPAARGASSGQGASGSSSDLHELPLQQPALRQSVSQPQPQCPLLPPIPPGRPLSTSSVRISSSGGGLSAASPPVSLPPLSPHPQQGDPALAAATQPPQTQLPQPQPPPFRAPSPPASPSPSPSSAAATRPFRRQHSATSLLAAAGLSAAGSAGGGGSAPARPYSCDGHCVGATTAVVPTAALAGEPPAGHVAAALSAQPLLAQEGWPANPSVIAFADPPAAPGQRQWPRPSLVDTAAARHPSVGALQAAEAAGAASPASPRKPGVVSVTPASPSAYAAAAAPTAAGFRASLAPRELRAAREPPVVAEEPSESDPGWIVSGDGVRFEVEVAFGAPDGGREEMEVEGDLEGEIEAEMDTEKGEEGDGGSGSPGAGVADEAGGPSGTAEGSVLTGTHISARPWSGPSTVSSSGGADGRMAGSGYPAFLLDDSVSSFDFRSPSAAALRPVSACSPPSPPPAAAAMTSSPPAPTLHPAVASTKTAPPPLQPSQPAAAAADGGGGTSGTAAQANGPVASGVGLPAGPGGRQQPPHPSHPARRQGLAAPGDMAWAKRPARPGLVGKHGSSAAPSAAPRGVSVSVAGGGGGASAAYNTFQVLQKPAASGGDAAANQYGAGDDGNGDGQPFTEEPLDERYGNDVATAAATLPGGAYDSQVTAAAPAPVAWSAAAAAPDYDALMLEINELAALRSALKAEFEMLGRAEAVKGLSTLSAHFTEPAAAAAGEADVGPDAPAAAVAAAPVPLLQWSLSGQSDAPPPPPPQAASARAAAPGATQGVAAAVLATRQLPSPVTYSYVPPEVQPGPQLVQHSQPGPAGPYVDQQLLLQQQQQPQLHASARWPSEPQVPEVVLAAPSGAPPGGLPLPAPTVPLPAAVGPTGPTQQQQSVPAVAYGYDVHGQGGWGGVAPPGAASWVAPAAAPAEAEAGGCADDSQALGSFAFAPPAVPVLGAGGGSTRLIAAPPPPLVPTPAPAPAQPALQWTIPVSVGTAAGGGGLAAAGAFSTPPPPPGGVKGSNSSAGGADAASSVSVSVAGSTPRKAAAAAQPKRSPSGGNYAAPGAPAAVDSPGPALGPGFGARSGGAGTAVMVGGGTASAARPTGAAATPAERPLIHEGSYAAAAVQARERAERERAAREALQAETAAAKAAIMQRSKSERAAGAPVAAAVAASPSAGRGGGGGPAAKDASPLGPKAPLSIGSYVRQPSPVRAGPAARSGGGDGTASGDSGASIQMAALDAPSSNPAVATATTSGTPSSNSRGSRIPTPQRARHASAAAAAASTAASPPPPPSRREESSDSDFDFLERASEVFDSESESPEAYDVSSKAGPAAPRPPRHDAFASPSSAAAASAAYRERLAEARPQPLRIPSSSVSPTPMGGASTASTVASRAVPTGGRRPGGGAAAVAAAAGPGGARPGDKGPSTPFTAAIRELMGLPGSAPLEQSRAAAGKQHQRQQAHQQQQPGGRGPAAQAAGAGAASGSGAGTGGVPSIDPLRLHDEAEDELMASLRRLDADILRRGLVSAGLINDPQLLQPAGLTSQGPAVKAAAGAAGGRAARGATKSGAAAAAGAAAASRLTNSLQQDQLRESLERLDMRLGALRRKMEGRACSLGTPMEAAAAPATGAAAAATAPRSDATLPREERRGLPATLAKSRTPTPNKAKAIRDQRQQQLSAAQGPTPPPARALSAQTPPKPASAPTMGTMGAAAAAAAAAEPPPLPQPAAAVSATARAGTQAHGMPPRAPAAKAPASAPTGPAAVNAAHQQQQQQQYQQQQYQQQQYQQQQYQQQFMAAAAANGMPYGMMMGGPVAFGGPGPGGGMMPPMFPPPPLPQQQQPAGSQQVTYVPAMLPNGQMAYVPQYVQPGAGAPGALPSFFHQAPPGLNPATPMMTQQHQPQHQPLVIGSPGAPPVMPMGMQAVGQGGGQGVYPASGPMMAWGAAAAAQGTAAGPQQQLQNLQQQQQQFYDSAAHQQGGMPCIGGGDSGGGGPSLYSFDRSGPAGYGTGYGNGGGGGSGSGGPQVVSPSGAAGGYGSSQQHPPPSQLPYTTGPPPSGPLPHYHSTVMRSRSLGSRDGQVLAAAAAAAVAGLTSPHHHYHQHHQQQQKHHQQQQDMQQPQTYHTRGPQGPQGQQPQHQQDPYHHPQQQHQQQHQRQGQGLSQPHPVQVQSFEPNGSSRGLGSASGSGSAGMDADAGVIKAVNLGLLLS